MHVNTYVDYLRKNSILKLELIDLLKKTLLIKKNNNIYVCDYVSWFKNRTGKSFLLIALCVYKIVNDQFELISNNTSWLKEMQYRPTRI